MAYKKPLPIEVMLQEFMPGDKFIQSLCKQYRRRGFLTPRQTAILRQKFFAKKGY